MELSLLPLMLLLISNIRPAHTQGQEASEEHNKAPKPRLTVQPEPSQIFRGETVTLTCDIQGEDWTYTWQCGDEQHNSEEKEFKITVQLKQSCKCKGCRKPFCSEWSDAVTLSVSERPKPVVRVQPDGRVFRGGQTVTLTCDIQETDVTSWSYSWNKDDSEIHVSQSQEYRISSVSESHAGNYSCTGRETGGSRYSHTSDKVTLTVSGSSGLEFSEAHALIIGVIAGLSVTFLLMFLLALLWCCKHNKGAGSPSPSTEYQLK
ncbi:kin of IRRE-like protein 1 [Sinocyclocheilus anshuiensis]|uniref:kin of IRRE-like protein 1 n=1 Tax=Sinocyclocheilus anshuiensis TaxID=1608454 RepID=UPI0007B7E808|nr:PREDICTED: kin of IRRE-like protein 1 [Sinocyclocheilus anshuiensis]